MQNDNFIRFLSKQAKNRLFFIMYNLVIHVFFIHNQALHTTVERIKGNQKLT